MIINKKPPLIFFIYFLAICWFFIYGCKSNKKIGECTATSSSDLRASTDQSIEKNNNNNSIYAGYIVFKSNSTETTSQPAMDYCQVVAYIQNDTRQKKSLSIDSGAVHPVISFQSKLISSRSCIKKNQNAFSYELALFVKDSDNANELSQRKASGYVLARLKGQNISSYFNQRKKFITAKDVDSLDKIDNYLLTQAYKDQYAIATQQNQQQMMGPAQGSDWHIGVCEQDLTKLSDIYKTIFNSLTKNSFNSGCVFYSDLIAFEEKIYLYESALSRLSNSQKTWGLESYQTISDIDKISSVFSFQKENTLIGSLLSQINTESSFENLAKNQQIMEYINKQYSWWNLISSKISSSNLHLKFYMTSLDNINQDFSFNNFFGADNPAEIKFISVFNTSIQQITEPTLEFPAYGVVVIDKSNLLQSLFNSSILMLGQLPIGVFTNWDNKKLIALSKPHRIFEYSHKNTQSLSNSQLDLRGFDGDNYVPVGEEEQLEGEERPLNEYIPPGNKPDC